MVSSLNSIDSFKNTGNPDGHSLRFTKDYGVARTAKEPEKARRRLATHDYGGQPSPFKKSNIDLFDNDLMLAKPAVALAKAGGQGGIRTPVTLAGQPDFESGAFNRALPPVHTKPIHRQKTTISGQLSQAGTLQ